MSSPVKIKRVDWSEENKNISADIILAAECCYDSPTCREFFKCVKKLFENKANCCYICFEERPNFMMEEMAGLDIIIITLILKFQRVSETYSSSS